MLGRDVRSAADEDMGQIVDVIVDRGGTVRAAVIDFGGFLGVGSRKIAVDWNALRFGRVADKSDSITLELTKDQVKAAPEYKEDKPVVVLGASGQPAAAAISMTNEPGGERYPVAAHPYIRLTGSTATIARRPAVGERPCAVGTANRRDGRDRLPRARACAASTGSSSFSPTCRPASARSSRFT